MNKHNYVLWCKLDISTFHNDVMVLTIRPHILWMQIIKTDHLDNLDPLDHLDNHKHLNHLEHMQRPKKSELSGWQLSTGKNFPDEVRKSFSRQKSA